MKFNLVNGEVKFLTHKVEHQQREETIAREFYDIDKKDAYITMLQGRGIEFTITELEQPSQDQIDRVEGRIFNTTEEARKAINGTEEKSELEILQETVDMLVLEKLGVL